MPEGHTIHRLARDHAQAFRGRPVTVTSPQGRFSDSAERLDGRVLTRVEAWGKHLFHRWDNGEILHVHLGLIGKWRPAPHGPHAEPAGQIRLRLADDVVAWDLSGPTVCRLVDPGEVQRVTAALGPDPLRRNADVDRFVARVRRSAKPIGALLLDQGVVAGIGNVYRAEVLFLHGIHPAVPGNELSEPELRALWDTLVAQLKAGVRRNRIVTLVGDDLPRNVAKLGKIEALYVYHRGGEPCRRCGTPVATADIAARHTWWCPTCQPAR